MYTVMTISAPTAAFSMDETTAQAEERAVLTYVLEYPGTKPIKIGQAKYFVGRLAQLKTGSPVDPVVLCAFHGSRHEREFHNRFTHLRHHGEFYHFTNESREYIFSEELAKHRMSREEAEAISPRIERAAEKLRGQQRNASAVKLETIKAAEMEAPLETDE